MNDVVGRHRLATAALALLAFVPRFAWGVLVRVPPAWDGELYERAARGIAQGLGYSCFMFGPSADPSVPTAYYPVGYPAALGLFYAVLGVAPWVVALLGSLAGAATVALAHRLALRVASPRAAALAGAWVALLPGSVLFASTPMTETLWGLLLLLAVYVLARRPTVTSRALALAGLALSLAVYVRPQAVVLAPLLPLALEGSWTQRLRRAALVSAVTVACVLPWTARNCSAVDGCAFVSTNGGSNLAIGALPGATGIYRVLTERDGCAGVVGENARDRCWRALARRSIRREPGRWLALAAAKLHHTYAYEAFPIAYLATARPELFTEATHLLWRRRISVPWRLLYLAALLAVLPFFPRRGLGVAGRLCLVTAATVILTHAVFFGGDRYHLPLVGHFAVLAAQAWRGLQARPTEQRLRAVSAEEAPRRAR